MVCEDALTVAFTDLRQVNPGHTLVLPKRHLRAIYALDDATRAALIATVARVARAVSEVFAPDGVNIMQSSVASAGQEVFHVHVHVLPRRHGDGLLRYGASPALPKRAELDAHAASIPQPSARPGPPPPTFTRT